MSRLLVTAASLTLAACHTAPRGSHPWIVKIIYASQQGHHIDPRARAFAEQLAGMHYTSLQVRDEATFNLETDSTGRMQLPDRTWFTLTARDADATGKQRLEIAMDHLQFHTTVTVDPGATVAVGGPPFGTGTLVLAVTLLM